LRFFGFITAKSKLENVHPLSVSYLESPQYGERTWRINCGYKFYVKLFIETFFGPINI
jgi:hypothetical protein